MYTRTKGRLKCFFFFHGKEKSSVRNLFHLYNTKIIIGKISSVFCVGYTSIIHLSVLPDFFKYNHCLPRELTDE